MDKKTYRIFLVVIILLFGNVVHSKEQNSALEMWAGVYRYEGVFSKNVSGVAPFADITIVLKPDGNCKIDAVGYQLNQRILCHAVPHDSEIKIIFFGYANDIIQTPSDAYYKNGDLLFLFMKKNGVLFTKWGKMKPCDRLKDTGKYFSVQ